VQISAVSIGTPTRNLLRTTLRCGFPQAVGQSFSSPHGMEFLPEPQFCRPQGHALPEDEACP
jgi:hypothetical protein